MAATVGGGTLPGGLSAHDSLLSWRSALAPALLLAVTMAP
jgi:hypothetical protein